MTRNTLRVALVGCGQIADAHLQQIRRIPCADLVAVCDREPLLARQAAERFHVPSQFTCLETLLETVRPDVIHLTTPVATHAPLAIRLLNAGVHVYVEKPLSVDGGEARRMLAAAKLSQRLLCLGHDQLFDPIWLECRRLIDQGAIGEVRHVESMLGYPIAGPFGQQVVSDPDHWVRRLPGGLFQNTMSHPLYRITEFLTDHRPEVWATWSAGVPGVPFPTEMQAWFRGRDVTGVLQFTSRVRPFRRMTRVQGTAGGLEVDLDGQRIRLDRGNRLPGAFGPVEQTAREFREAGRSLRRNLSRFIRGDLHYFDGMKELITQFYAAILNGTDTPVPMSEALRVTELMDRIFECCRSEGAAEGNSPESAGKPLRISSVDQQVDAADQTVDTAAAEMDTVDERDGTWIQPDWNGKSPCDAEPLPSARC